VQLHQEHLIYWRSEDAKPSMRDDYFAVGFIESLRAIWGGPCVQPVGSQVVALGKFSRRGLEVLVQLADAVNVSSSFPYPVVRQQSPADHDDLFRRPLVSEDLSKLLEILR
jgi:hypothetical protein